MAGFREVRISAPVGRDGRNLRFDVIAIQELINARLPTPLRPLEVDGLVGPLTINAIEVVERRYISALKPDGRIDPFGPTLRALNGVRKSMPRGQAAAGPPPPSSTASGTPTRSVPVPAARSAAVASARSAAQAPQRVASNGNGGHPVSRHARPIPPAVVSAAQAAQRKWNVPASITIAQWTLESGWGKRMPRGSNNPFGIKAAKGQPYVLARTREERRDGSSYYIMAPFRVFRNMEEAFEEHGRLLATHRAYARARQFSREPDRYADALTRTYATDNGYGETLRKQMRYHNLYSYDV